MYGRQPLLSFKCCLRASFFYICSAFGILYSISMLFKFAEKLLDFTIANCICVGLLLMKKWSKNISCVK